MRSEFDTITQQENGSGCVGEQPKPTFKPPWKKVMICVWWNSKGLVYFEGLNVGQTVTGDFYREQLNRVDQALKRQEVNIAKTKFLHDNARLHIGKITQQKIGEMGWKLLPYAP